MSKVTRNLTGLEPMGHALLCEPYEPEFQNTKIAIPEAVRVGSKMREMRAIVIAIGPDAWNRPDREAMTRRCEPGDKVLISKFAGVIVRSPVDDKDYRLCNDEDVFCRITAESWEQVGVIDPLVEPKQSQVPLRGVK
jgi:co-chaperonin GroES (HSP10)